MWSIVDKRVVITGGNSGIGYETARELSRRGALVTLVVRNRERGEVAAQSIGAECGREPELVVGDLSSGESLGRVAEELLERYRSIDVLINNAGGYFAERRESADGLEYTFALNHMSYFRLTMQLLERLKASAPARIINVSSAAHRRARLDFDDLQNRRRYRGFSVYSQSKLANIYFTRTLSRRLSGSGVTVNALHPGFVRSRFGENNRGKGLVPIIFNLLSRLLAVDQAKGAETSVYLAAAPELSTVSGAYFADCRETKPRRQAFDDKAAERLWEISEKLA